MATSWHVPLHDSSSTDDAFEDPFDDNFELTFPPMRYWGMSVAKPQQKLRRDSSRERERLYKELVGHDPYLNKNKDKSSNEFLVTLDVTHYKPEEITMKVEGQQLIVTGKHHNSHANGYESSEFQRRYTIPESVDPHSLTSNISADGLLYIKPTHINVTSGNTSKDDEPFVLSLDVPGYRPDEISIRVKGHTLIIHGETRDENANDHGVSSHHQQFTRHFSLPFDIDIDSLSSKYTKDKKICIEASRGSNVPARKLEIKEE